MTPLLADGIDVPLVVMFGLIVLIPLMAFEVYVEALVLKPIWRLPYRKLCAFTLFANLWSLLAGIPTKFLTSWLDGLLIPGDIPGFFARYPLAALVGTTVYFVITVLVEGACAFRWRSRNAAGLSRAKIWTGVLLANAATYAVLGPLDYAATRPRCEIREFKQDARWTAQPAVRVIFIDGTTHQLKCERLDGSDGLTIVPFPTTEYLISTNLETCLVRDPENNVWLYRRGANTKYLVCKSEERSFMSRAAFSASGERVVYASEINKSIEVVDVTSGRKTRLPMPENLKFDHLAMEWSVDGRRFFARNNKTGAILAAELTSTGELVVARLEDGITGATATCFGWTADSEWADEADGVSYSSDTCGDLRLSTWPGLESQLVIGRGNPARSDPVFKLRIAPGWLPLPSFFLHDVAFLPDCRECLFDANGYIYLLDAGEKRLGTFAKGENFILLTPRYQRKF